MKHHLLLFITAVSATISAESQAFTLRFITDRNQASGRYFSATAMGGISGLAYVPETGLYLALSDDRSQNSAARFYTLDITEIGTSAAFFTSGVTTLTATNDLPFAPGMIDPEAIAYFDSDHIFISSEGDGLVTPRLPPSIFVSRSDGHITGNVALPSKFLPNLEGEAVYGVINNAAIEGLSLSPDRSILFAVTEDPLLQDGSQPTFEAGGMSRGIAFQMTADGQVAGSREFVYPVDPARRPTHPEIPYIGNNGVSEIIALSNTQLIVMERGGFAEPDNQWRVYVKLYLVDISQATDVSAIDSLVGQTFVPATKTLLLDLDDIVPQLTEGFRSLDNLEAMAFGPLLSDGSRDLFLMSDDNFNPAQRTQLLAFRLSGF